MFAGAFLYVNFCDPVIEPNNIAMMTDICFVSSDIIFQDGETSGPFILQKQNVPCVKYESSDF
jgi:hypothetical protein